MKKALFIVAVSMVFLGCKNGNSVENTIAESSTLEQGISQAEYQYFGEEITDEMTLSQDEMMEEYNKLKVGDTVMVKFTSEVKEVCQKKGCWMKMDMGDKEAMIRFKDYGFFMPKDIAGKELILEGKAYIEEMSIADQRHYAEDGGKSAEEIAAIIEPKQTLAFEAHGVLIPE